VIGRVPGNDIIIDDPQVSRHHASLTLEGGQWVLRDLGSTNGTTVNGQPVTTHWVVRPGDVIGLGDALAVAQFSTTAPEASTLAGARPSAQPGVTASGGRSWALAAIVAVLFTLALVVTAVLLLVVLRRPAPVPQVVISAPTSGVIVAPGSTVEVQALATDEQGVTRIDLRADNVVVASQTAPDARGVSPFAAVLSWPASAPGPHTLVVTAHNAAGVSSQPAVVLVNVAMNGDVGTTTPPVTGTPAPGSGTPGDTDVLPTAALATATATAIPTATPIPVPTPTVCVDNAAFVADVTVPDGMAVAPGQRIDKVWRLRNSGNCRWGAGYGAVFVSGNQMSGPGVVAIPETPVGGTVDVTVTLIAPGTPGTYTGYWQLRNPVGALFGRPFLVQVVVPAPPTATPEAVISFSADRTEVRSGECAVLRWNVENVSAVYLGDEGVVGQGSRSVCPGTTTTYTLRIVRRDGGTEERRVTISVTGAEVPRPAALAPPDRSEFDRYPRDVEFLWTSVDYPGGVWYSIEIQYGSAEGTDWERWELQEGLEESRYYMESFIGALNVGRWRVWAVSRVTGQSSARTEWRYFRFLQ
jgi:hypothetical protein